MEKLQWKVKHDIDFSEEVDFLETILHSDGVENIEAFLSPTYNCTYNPFLLDNMEKGIQLLHDNIDKKIFIKVDCDTDGFTSAAVLKQFIEKFGKPVGIPNYLDFSKQIGIEKLQHLLMQEMQRKNNQVHYENKEKEDLKIILKTQTDAFPDDLDSKTCKLILSLFAVLDVSERAVLIQILKNPNTFSLFLQKLKFMKKDNNLIASVRIELERLKGQAELENASREPARIADVVRKIEIQRVKD